MGKGFAPAARNPKGILVFYARRDAMLASPMLASPIDAIHQPKTPAWRLYKFPKRPKRKKVSQISLKDFF
jgi:hypothetical protein